MNHIDKARTVLTKARERLSKLLAREDLSDKEAKVIREAIESVETEIDGIDQAREADG